MEMITVLVLILLGTVGARNIPVNMDETAGVLQPVLADDLPSYTKAVLTEIFPTGDLMESPVNVENLELPHNKNLNEEEFEDDMNDVALNIGINAKSLDNNKHDAATNDSTKLNKNNKDDTMLRISKPGEVTSEAQEKMNPAETEDRVSLTANECPNDKARVSTQCWQVQ